MLNIEITELLKAGAHFGHKTDRWNPKMKPYIFDIRQGTHIINIRKTVSGLEHASNFLGKISSQNKSILFVGTKRQARPIIVAEAERAGVFSVTERWLGGTLTNFKTIRNSVSKLKELEKQLHEKGSERLTKKEILMLQKKREKLERYLSGIKEMDMLPSAIFVVDVKHEGIAVHESKILGIPVVGIVDTNSDPDPIDYIIPANDDAMRSVALITQYLADAILLGKTQHKDEEPVPEKDGDSDIEEEILEKIDLIQS
ncbi:30S ribosomal protein S2 [candidate division WOR-3 bacterium]|nr:30S ribosomal protein S2 [candidate division WOR-3 bacterium]